MNKPGEIFHKYPALIAAPPNHETLSVNAGRASVMLQLSEHLRRAHGNQHPVAATGPNNMPG